VVPHPSHEHPGGAPAITEFAVIVSLRRRGSPCLGPGVRCAETEAVNPNTTRRVTADRKEFWRIMFGANTSASPQDGQGETADVVASSSVAPAYQGKGVVWMIEREGRRALKGGQFEVDTRLGPFAS